MKCSKNTRVILDSRGTQYTTMTDISPTAKKRENPDVDNKPVRAVKFAKLASPASVLDIPGDEDEDQDQDSQATVPSL